METVNVHDAKSQLSALINKVLKGEKVIIARNNQPVVEIVPLQTKKRIPGQSKGKIKLLEKWEDGDENFGDFFNNSEIFPK